ncbi:hypothetical protein D3C79_1069920 [compost metagenome]
MKPRARAASIDTTMVTTTDTTTISTGCQPSATICSSEIRKPSKATPTRRISRALKSIPALLGPAARKFMAMPSKSANSITGA